MYVRSIARVLTLALVLTALSPVAAVARPASSTVGLAKPPIVAHPDVAPRVPGNLAGASVTPDRAGMSLASVASILPGASGTNGVSFGSFKDGDIIVVLDPASVTGHAGLFDRRYYSTLNSFAVWSANVSPANGVQREQCVKYRATNKAYGLRVSGGSSYAASSRSYAARQLGKPYNIAASKTDTRSFYCSKLAWASWRYTFGVDLDGDGGYWVWPVDLINSSHTVLFGYWS